MVADRLQDKDPEHGRIIIFKDRNVPCVAEESVRRIQALVGTPYDKGFLCQYAVQKDLTDKSNHDYLSDLFFKAESALNSIPNCLGYADESELRSIASSVSGAKNRSASKDKRYLDDWSDYSAVDLRSGIIYELEAQLGNVRRICAKVEDSQVWGKIDRYGLTDDLSADDRQKILSSLKETDAIGQIAKESRRIEKTYGEYRRAIKQSANALDGISAKKRRSVVDSLLQYSDALETIDNSLAFLDALQKSGISLYLAASGRIEKMTGYLDAKDRSAISSLRDIGISGKDMLENPLVVRCSGDDFNSDDLVHVPSMDIYSRFLEGLEDMGAVVKADEKSGRIRLTPKDTDSWSANYSKMHVYAAALNEIKDSGVWIGGTSETPVLLSDTVKFHEVRPGSASGHMMKRDILTSIIRVLPEDERIKYHKIMSAPDKSIAEIYAELKSIETSLVGEIPAKPADAGGAYYSLVEPLNEPGRW